MAIKLNDLLNPRILVALYKSKTTLELIGPPGIGKSSVIRQFPSILSEALGIEMPPISPKPEWRTEILLPSVDAPDVRGFMVPTKDEGGRMVARYTRPALIPSHEVLAKYEHGIQFYDESNQADPIVTKGMAPMYLEQTLGEYSLPEGWWVVTASNRMSDRAGVVKEPMHVVNRKRKIYIQPDIVGLLEWMRDNGVHPMGIAFAKANPGVIFTEAVPADPRPFCTPRSFVSAMRFIQEVAGDSMVLPTDHVTQECVEGDIGSAASTFFGYIKVAEHLPTIDEILKAPDRAKLPPNGRLDAAFAAREMCIHHVTSETVDPIWTYVMRLPRELQVSTAKILLDTKNSKGRAVGTLLNSKNFSKWVADNRALIVATSAD